jgi:pilus assembly protein CpaC
MNNTVNSTMQKIPGIGDIPILGALFQSKAAQKSQTELVVMITPEILPNNSSGVTTTLPRPIEPYMGPAAVKKPLDQPAPAFKNQGASVTAPIVPVATAAPANTNTTARDAAAAVSALNPNTRTVVNGDAAKAANDTTPAAVRQMTDSEKKAFAKAQKQERDRLEAEAKTKAAEDARLAKDAQVKAAKQGEEDRRRLEADKKQAAADKELQEKAAKEQAKREAELAKKQSASTQKAQ